MKVRRIESVLRDAVASYDARSPIRQAEDALPVLASLLAERATEGFAVVLLNGRHRPIGVELVSQGTATSALVHPREVFGAAVRMGAVAIIVGHNHPSGDPEPSQEDVAATRRLVQAGQLLGIPVLDSIVLGEGTRYRSIRTSNPETFAAE